MLVGAWYNNGEARYAGAALRDPGRELLIRPA